ncbi:MAG TPA: helix-turn-helix domain-containing protein, partial [bacterium]|nr:helix-turn-helix domain-containing protein [bacterium]
NRSIKGISAEAAEMMLRYTWPGNVRELKNVLERAVILCKREEITPELLHLEPVEMPAAAPAPPAARTPGTVNADGETLAEIERQHVLRTLEKYHNNKSRTAKALNISRSTLREKLKEYGLE